MNDEKSIENKKMYLALPASLLNIPYLCSDCVNLNMCKVNNVHYGWYTLS